VTRETVSAASLFLTDDFDQFSYYRGLGHFEGWPEPDGTVGAMLLGESPQVGREAPVVCCNLGVAVLDAFFAAHVLGQPA
jgi:hypothetical protein